MFRSTYRPKVNIQWLKAKLEQRLMDVPSMFSKHAPSSILDSGSNLTSAPILAKDKWLPLKIDIPHAHGGVSTSKEGAKWHPAFEVKRSTVCLLMKLAPTNLTEGGEIYYPLPFFSSFFLPRGASFETTLCGEFSEIMGWNISILCH